MMSCTTRHGASEEVSKRALTAHRDGVALATESFGRAGAPGVVLVMGATASMVWWPDDFCRDLAAAGFYVVRYDHRDTGRSTTGTPGRVNYHLEDLAADLLAVLDAHGLTRAHLIGMSLGGLLAQMTAVTHTDRVLSLILVASESLGGASGSFPPADERVVAHFQQLDRVDWRDPYAASAFMVEAARLCAGHAHPFDETKVLQRARAEVSRARNVRSAFNHALLSASKNWRSRSGHIRQRTIIVHGEADPVVPIQHAFATLDFIPDATLVVLEGVGHELLDCVFNELKVALDQIVNDRVSVYIQHKKG